MAHGFARTRPPCSDALEMSARFRPLQRATRDIDDDARKAAQAALEALMARIKR